MLESGNHIMIRKKRRGGGEIEPRPTHMGFLLLQVILLLLLLIYLICLPVALFLV